MWCLIVLLLFYIFYTHTHTPFLLWHFLFQWMDKSLSDLWPISQKHISSYRFGFTASSCLFCFVRFPSALLLGLHNVTWCCDLWCCSGSTLCFSANIFICPVILFYLFLFRKFSFLQPLIINILPWSGFTDWAEEVIWKCKLQLSCCIFSKRGSKMNLTWCIKMHACIYQ